MDSSPLTSLRGFVDDQTIHVHVSGQDLAERLLEAVYEPTDTHFGEKREVHVPAADPGAGLVVAGQPLWYAPGLAGGDEPELAFGVGPDAWLRANCLAPAQKALAASLSALRAVWDHRTRGRPTLICILMALRMCVKPRFTHFARWFPPHIAREALHAAHVGIASFVRGIAGWSDFHFYNDDQVAGLMLEFAQPLRDGGAAVAPLPALAEPAYVAAWFDSAVELAQDRDVGPRVVLAEWDLRASGPSALAPLRHLARCLQLLPEPAGSLCELWDRHAHSVKEGEFPRWQKCFTKALWLRVAADRELLLELLPVGVAKRERKRLSAKASHGAARWLSVLPVYRYDYLEDLEARDFLSWWMGVPLEAIRTGPRAAKAAGDCIRRRCHLRSAAGVRCTCEWRGYEDHPFGVCASGRTALHDCAVRILGKELKRRPLGLAVEVESWEPSFPPPRRAGHPCPHGERARRAAEDTNDEPCARLDLRVECLRDATNVVDYKLGGATCPSAPQSAAVLFSRMATRNRDQYRERDDEGRRATNLKLRPFIQSTFGSIGPDAVAFLADVRAETGASTRALQDRLAIFLARAVARRLRRAYGAYSVPPPETAGWWPEAPQPGSAPPGGDGSGGAEAGWWGDALASDGASDAPAAGTPGDGAAAPGGAPRKGGKPRESKPLRGAPGGIYGPDGARLPPNVFYLKGKKRYQSGLGQTKGKNRVTLAVACPDAALLVAGLALPNS